MSSSVTITTMSQATTRHVVAAGPVDVSSIRKAIRLFLKGCEMTPSTVSFHHPFLTSCLEEAALRGCPKDGPLARFMPAGAFMSMTAYAHLPNQSTRRLIAIFTACGLYFDDVFQKDVEIVRNFNSVFLKGESHGDPVLDCYAAIMREMPAHFGAIAGNIMVTSTLASVTALLLEHETQGMKIHRSAEGYPMFTRIMSCESEAYSLFAFPPEISIRSYIQAIPALMIFSCNVNDMLSFYKEELAQESVNNISLLAAQKGTTKSAVLLEMAQNSVTIYRSAVDTIRNSGDNAALEALRSYTIGAVAFHLSLDRYRLKELDLS